VSLAGSPRPQSFPCVHRRSGVGVLLSLALLLGASAPRAQPLDAWQIEISVEIGGLVDRGRLGPGAGVGASSGYDGFDVPHPPALPSAFVDIVTEHTELDPGWAEQPVSPLRYREQFDEPLDSVPRSVAFQLDTDQTGPATLAWGPIVSPFLDDFDVFLVDPGAGASVDMRAQTLYVLDAVPGTRPMQLDLVPGRVEPVDAEFSATPTPGTLHEPVRFSDLSTDPDGFVVAWRWSFGDGTTSNEQSPTHTYEQPGSFEVRLSVVDDQGNTDTRIQALLIRAPPAAAFSFSPIPAVSGEEIRFADASSDADGSIVGWAWDFDGDGTADSTDANPSHTFSQNGSFPVSLTVTDDSGLSRTTTRTLAITIPPVAAFHSVPTSPAQKQPVVFSDDSADADGSVVGWSWSFGDAARSSLQNPTHKYAAQGSFEVVLRVVDDAGASSSVSQTIVVDAGEPPVAQFGFAPEPPPVGAQIRFTDESTDPDNAITAWEWDFGDGKTSDEQHPVHVYSEPGTVDITLRVTDEAGNTSAVTLSGVPVAERPEAGFRFDPPDPIVGEQVQFTDTSTDSDGSIVSHSWDFEGDGVFDSTDRNPTHGYAAPGSFDVTLTVTDSNGLSDSAVQTVVVVEGQRPTAAFSFSPDSPLAGETVQFSDESTDDGSIVQYEWDFEDDGVFDSTDPNPAHAFDAAGSFDVVLKVTDDENLSDTATATVTTGLGAAPDPLFSFDPDPPVAGALVQFSDESSDPDDPIVAWAWDFGDGGTSDQQHPAHTYDEGGTVDVSLTVTDRAGNSSTGVLVGFRVLTPPTAAFTTTPSRAAAGALVQFEDASSDDGSIVQYEWDFEGDGVFDSVEQNPTHSFPNQGSFDVLLRVTDDDGLRGEASRTFEVLAAGDVVAAFSAVPNPVVLGEAVDFVDESTGGQPIVAWSWDFENDGIVDSTAQNPRHTYPNGGHFDVTLLVMDGLGTSDATTRSVTVQVPPEAIASASQEMNVALIGNASIVDFSSAGAFGPPENAIDANAGSTWTTATGMVTDQFISVDLAGDIPQAIDRVAIVGSGASGGLRNFDIQVSTTGIQDVDFQTVFSGMNPQDALRHEYAFQVVPALFVRLVLRDNWGNPQLVFVNQFEVLTRHREGGIVSLREGASSRAVAASINDHLADRMLDDDPNSGWLGDFFATAEEFVKVELGGGNLYTIDRIRLQSTSASAGPRNFSIRVSTTTADDSEFVEVFNGTTAADTTLQEFSLGGSVPARFVELRIADNHGANRTQVNTFQVLTPEGANVSRLEGVGALVAEVSSEFSAIYAAERAIEFAPLRAWSTTSGQNTDQFLTVLLSPGVPHVVDKVRIDPVAGSPSPQDFEIRVSTNGLDPGDFSTVVSGSLPSDGAARWFGFPPVEAIWVQLFIVNNHGNADVEVESFRVFSPGRGAAEVTFDDRSRADGRIVDWAWDFGDGEQSSERNPRHTFPGPGTYPVQLTVTDDQGLSDTSTLDYTVLSPPDVDFDWNPEFPNESDRFVLDASVNRADGAIVRWEWEGPDSVSSPSSRNTTAVIVDNGDRAVTLTALDSQLLTGTATHVISVANVPPLANPQPDQTFTWGDSERLLGDPRDQGSEDAQNLVCDYDFGDGQSLRLQPCSASSLFQHTHAYDVPGTYLVTLTVTDPDGASATDTRVITVEKRPSHTTIWGDLEKPPGGGPITAHARLIDFHEPSRGEPLEGLTFRFSLGGESIDVLTDANGEASAVLTFAPDETGVVEARFGGTPFYNPSMDRPFVKGDVLVAVGNGFVLRYEQDGSFVNLFDTLTGSQETAGMAFDGSGDLYATSFQANQITKFDRRNGVTIVPWGGPFSLHPESVVYDPVADVIYTGEVDGQNDIRKFDTDGNLLDQFDVMTIDRGADWMDLAADRCTMFHTSEGDEILRYDVCTGQQLEDFVPDQHPNSFDNHLVPKQDRLPELAIDENPATFWSARRLQVVDQYITVDLVGDAAVLIDRIYLNSGSSADSVNDFELRVSLTGLPGDFQTVLADTLPLSNLGQEFVLPSPVSARFAQLFVVDNRGGQFVQVFSFEVLDANGTNLAADADSASIADFSSVDSLPMLTRPCFALRIRPNREVLQACRNEVVRISPSGRTQLSVYPRALFSQAQNLVGSLFALNLDPDGSSFWTAAQDTSRIFKVDIESGDIVTSFPVDRRTKISGLAVFDEPTAAFGNAPPLADAQSVQTQENTPLAIGLTGSDPEGQPLSFRVVTPPMKGSLSGEPPNVVYTPDLFANGPDRFSFVSNDGQTDSDPADVDIDVLSVADAPRLLPPPGQDLALADQVLDEGTTLDVAVTAVDPDGDPISLVASGLPAFAAFVDNGDGTGSLGLAPGFEDAGEYPGVTVTASDASGGSSSASFRISVRDVNRPPVADAGGPYQADEGALVTLTGTGSDPDGDVLLFAWDLDGDGSHGDALGAQVEPAFPDDGVYPVELLVSDGVLSDVAASTVTVGDLGPTSAFDWAPRPQLEGSPVAFSDQSTSAPDALAAWSWSFAGLGVSAEQNPSFSFPNDGLYPVSLSVTDDDGSVANVIHDVSVSNAPPRVDAGPDQTIDSGDTLDLAPASFSDPGTLDTHSASIDWGDGSGPTPGAVTEAGGAGTVSGSHLYADAGSFTLEVCVTDDGGATGCDSLGVSVDTGDRPPLLDPIGDLELDEGAVLDVPVSATDPDDDPIVLSVTGLPAFGSFTDAGNGQGTLSLAPGFDAAGSYPGVEFTASANGLADSETLSITVNDVNRAPVADAGPDQNVQTGQVVGLDGSDSFDPDGDMISFEWTVEWSLTAVPAGSLLSDADLTGRDTPSPSFTPDVDGVYVVELVVNDGPLDSDPDTVEISATTPNTPPNADAGPDQSVELGDLVLLDGSASNDPDDGPEPLGFLWSFLQLPAQSALGDADIAGGDQAQAQFTPDVVGDYLVNLQVLDGEDADDDQALILVSVANVPPNADAGADRDVALGEQAFLDGTASNDPDQGPQALGFSWRFVSVPAGSALTNADLEGADTATPSFVPDLAGSYVLELEVFDGADNDFDNAMVDVQAAPPAPVTDLVARAKSGKVDLVWTPVPGAEGYDVYRSEDGTSFERIAEGHQSDYAVYADFGLTDGVTYTYYVTAVGPGGAESAPSNEASATPTARRRR